MGQAISRGVLYEARPLLVNGERHEGDAGPVWLWSHGSVSLAWCSGVMRRGTLDDSEVSLTGVQIVNMEN